jgi:4-aminobutyrate aminotransferase
VTPDILTGAKGLGNGTPVGLTVARPEIADAVAGATISTFGGNPVTATAAKAVIDFIDDHKLLINAAEVGAYLRGRLEEMKARYPLIGEVRGMGLMQAIELVDDRESRAPATEATAAVMESARENRLLVGKGGMFGNVIRVTPPLNIAKSDVDEFALRLDASLKYVSEKRLAGAAG